MLLVEDRQQRLLTDFDSAFAHIDIFLFSSEGTVNFLFWKLNRHTVSNIQFQEDHCECHSTCKTPNNPN